MINKNIAVKIAGTYRKLAKKYGWHIVNASQSKDQVHQQIQKTDLSLTTDAQTLISNLLNKT